MTDFLEFLKATSYPGRGILVGHGIFVHGALSGKGGAAENQRRRLYHTV